MDNPVTGAAKDGEGLLARIQHPIFGAFAGSWIIWNWKSIYLMICGFKTPEITIQEISDQYIFLDDFHNHYFKWGMFLWYPFSSTVFILVAGPVLHDGYMLFKKWVNAWVNKIEPVSRVEYQRLEGEKNKMQQERFIIQGAYNLLRNKPIQLPPYPPNRPSSQSLEAEQVIQNYFSTDEDRQKLWNENSQLKADLLEAQKKIEELEKK